jgi:hypothetical protein
LDNFGQFWTTQNGRNNLKQPKLPKTARHPKTAKTAKNRTKTAKIIKLLPQKKGFLAIIAAETGNIAISHNFLPPRSHNSSKTWFTTDFLVQNPLQISN